MNEGKVRTRFAPSPTGFIHVGNIRTALFAWLTARHFNGEFILRIEDTDQKREVSGAYQHIIDSLKALGLNYDEGPDAGGEYGPYLQSERLDTYKQWAQKLIDEGRAYADPYTKEQIDEFRQQAISNKRPFLYRMHRPENPPKWDGTTALRLKSEPQPYNWHDEVMGDLSSKEEAIDDIILIKSDGFPTYNFAHIIDDAEMKVTHIIRGQEFLASMPNYMGLYEALDITPPRFATVPHIMAESGNKKMGKRDGAKDVLDYLKDGILKEALLNFIASLGWNDGTEQEIFSIDEIIHKFSLDRIQQSGARFDQKRLLWMNGQWLRKLSTEELFSRSAGFWPSEADSSTDEQKLYVLSIVQDRIKTLADLSGLTKYFFCEPVLDWAMLKETRPIASLSNDQIKNLLQVTLKELTNSSFELPGLSKDLENLLVITDSKPATLYSLIRLVVSWAPFSPSLDVTLHAIGKERVLKRINLAIDSL